MFHKPFYITLTFIVSLLFVSQKSSGNITFEHNHKTHAHINETPVPITHQNITDFLINIDDDDDETASKTKYKVSRGAIHLNAKSNCINNISSNTRNNFAHCLYLQKNHTNFFRFSKTSISIAICCLKI